MLNQIDYKKQIGAYLPHENLLVTARGTSALWLALSILEPQKRGVLVPANVCEVVIAAILYSDLEPIFVDVDPIIGNIDIHHLESSPFDKAGILIAVHNFGVPLPIHDIYKWAHSHDIFVIEDACNALGAETQGHMVGELGDAAIYSFGSNKILNIGYGGILTARDPFFLHSCNLLAQTLDIYGETQRRRDFAIQDCLRTLRKHPELKDPTIYRVVYENYKSALVARASDKLPKMIAQVLKSLSMNLNIRRRRAESYREHLNHPVIMHPPPQQGEVCWRYICHLPANLRDGAIKYLKDRNLPISSWYPAVDRLFRERPPDYTLPGADSFEQTVINLWVDPSVNEDIVEKSYTYLLEYLIQNTGYC
jgi:dTDP-4-amino-4,6-dideoxygalactose transaminase